MRELLEDMFEDMGVEKCPKCGPFTKLADHTEEHCRKAKEARDYIAEQRALGWPEKH